MNVSLRTLGVCQVGKMSSAVGMEIVIQSDDELDWTGRGSYIPIQQQPWWLFDGAQDH